MLQRDVAVRCFGQHQRFRADRQPSTPNTRHPKPTSLTSPTAIPGGQLSSFLRRPDFRRPDESHNNCLSANVLWSGDAPLEECLARGRCGVTAGSSRESPLSALECPVDGPASGRGRNWGWLGMLPSHDRLGLYEKCLQKHHHGEVRQVAPCGNQAGVIKTPCPLTWPARIGLSASSTDSRFRPDGLAERVTPGRASMRRPTEPCPGVEICLEIRPAAASTAGAA